MMVGRPSPSPAAIELFKKFLRVVAFIRVISMTLDSWAGPGIKEKARQEKARKDQASVRPAGRTADSD